MTIHPAHGFIFAIWQGRRSIVIAKVRDPSNDRQVMSRRCTFTAPSSVTRTSVWKADSVHRSLGPDRRARLRTGCVSMMIRSDTIEYISVKVRDDHLSSRLTLIVLSFLVHDVQSGQYDILRGTDYLFHPVPLQPEDQPPLPTPLHRPLLPGLLGTLDIPDLVLPE